MELYVCIMAGGVGSRFWPRSKQKRPKQLLQIFGNNSMIKDTVNRLDGLVSKEKIFRITSYNVCYTKLLRTIFSESYSFI